MVGGKSKRQRLRKLSGEVRDSPFPLPQFIDLGEPCSQKLSAPRALTEATLSATDRRAPPC
jgi:hypothetical protein